MKEEAMQSTSNRAILSPVITTNHPGTAAAPKYTPYHLRNFRQIPAVQEYLSPEQLFDIEVVGRVFPFRLNNYVAEQLIDWRKGTDDPIFNLTMPVRGMLRDEHYDRIAGLLRSGASEEEIKNAADATRLELDPHPAGQLQHNRPRLNGELLEGVQHKYRETALFFPSPGQTCHAYCTYCFRWAQFVGMSELKIAMKEADLLWRYLETQPEVTDVLFTGGDPMTMRASVLRRYVEPLLQPGLEHVQNIRIGTKALSYWPYRFVNDADSDDILRLFSQVVQSGKHLAVMAHFTHPREMNTPTVRRAIENIRATGAEIRTQSPIVANINDDAEVWARMWREQVRLGMIPYYMFIARNTGAQHHFAVPLERAWRIFKRAYRQVSGLARSVRGPVMSCHPGKVQVLGVKKVGDEKVFVLRALQARQPERVHQPFFARYDPEAVWFDQLAPADEESTVFFQQ
jgi:KamA family protein